MLKPVAPDEFVADPVSSRVNILDCAERSIGDNTLHGDNASYGQRRRWKLK